MRQYFSLYWAVSQREGEREERIVESKNVQTTPTRTYCKHNRPLSYCNQNCRTPRHWKFTQHHRTTRPPPGTALNSQGEGEGGSSFGVNDDQSTVINQTREETDTEHSDSVSSVTSTSSTGSTDASSSTSNPTHIQGKSPNNDPKTQYISTGVSGTHFQDPSPRTTAKMHTTVQATAGPSQPGLIQTQTKTGNGGFLYAPVGETSLPSP